MSVTNLGTQTINWKYKTSLKGSNLSKMFNGCINPGIYLNNNAYITAGTGLVTSFAGNQITINAFTAVFKASSTQTVHISTASPIMLSTDGSLGYITEAAPYITMSYTWADQVINYIDFAFKTVGDLTAYDLVIGKAEFTLGSVTSIDYSVASYPPVYNPHGNSFLYKGNELTTKNTITGYNTNTTFTAFTTNTDIYCSGTANRTADITAGASMEGIELCVTNTSSTYTVEIIYISGKSLLVSYNNFIKFKWNGTSWVIIGGSNIEATGTEKMFFGDVAPGGWIIEDGKSLANSGGDYNGTVYYALYAHIWDLVNRSIVTSTYLSSAKGASASADWSANKKIYLPNMQAVSPKGAGTQLINTRSKTGPALGVPEEDQTQGHSHPIGNTYSGTGGAYICAGSGTPIQVQNTGSPASDSTNGTPRTGAVTRDCTSGKNFIIKL